MLDELRIENGHGSFILHIASKRNEILCQLNTAQVVMCNHRTSKRESSESFG